MITYLLTELTWEEQESIWLLKVMTLISSPHFFVSHGDQIGHSSEYWEM